MVQRMMTTSERRNRGLSQAQIERVAPSVFAEQPHSRTSSRYSFYPTSDVLSELVNRYGFVVTYAAQSRTRIDGMSGFVPHVLRFRKPNVVIQGVGTEWEEFELRNSHNGGGAYVVSYAWYRLLCDNGLTMRTDDTFLRVPHKGNVVTEVIDASFAVLEQGEALQPMLLGMRELEVSESDQMLLATAMFDVRFGINKSKHNDDDMDEEGEEVKMPLTESEKQARRALVPFRPEQLLLDRHNTGNSTLWPLYNNIEENAVEKPISAYAGEGRERRLRSTRPIHSIQARQKYTGAAWDLARMYYALRSGDMTEEMVKQQ